MIKYRTVLLTMNDKEPMNIYIWDNVENPKGIVQFIHGSCEHIFCYQRFIEFLNKNHIIVIGHNIRGHGKEAYESKTFGFFKKKDGWNQLISDEKIINNYIKQEFPQLPIHFFGHSMGTFIIRNYIGLYPDTVNKIVLSGTGNYNPFLIKLFIVLAKVRIKKHNLYKPDDFLFSLSYKPLNKPFQKETPNPLAFVSRDPAVWKKNLEDKYIFKYFSASGYRDLGKGIINMMKTKTYEKKSKKVDILMLSGEMDPVGGFGKKEKRLDKIQKKYQKFGHNCSYKVYQNLRHSIIHEPEHNIVQKDIIDFINS